MLADALPPGGAAGVSEAPPSEIEEVSGPVPPSVVPPRAAGGSAGVSEAPPLGPRAPARIFVRRAASSEIQEAGTGQGAPTPIVIPSPGGTKQVFPVNHYINEEDFICLINPYKRTDITIKKVDNEYKIANERGQIFSDCKHLKLEFHDIAIRGKKVKYVSAVSFSTELSEVFLIEEIFNKPGQGDTVIKQKDNVIFGIELKSPIILSRDEPKIECRLENVDGKIVCSHIGDISILFDHKLLEKFDLINLVSEAPASTRSEAPDREESDSPLGCSDSDMESEYSSDEDNRPGYRRVGKPTGERAKQQGGCVIN